MSYYPGYGPPGPPPPPPPGQYPQGPYPYPYPQQPQQYGYPPPQQYGPPPPPQYGPQHYGPPQQYGPPQRDRTGCMGILLIAAGLLCSCCPALLGMMGGGEGEHVPDGGPEDSGHGNDDDGGDL